MKINRIVFRADGSTQVGLGHVMRCLSLVELLAPHYDCLFILNRPESNIKKLVSNFCNVYSINCLCQKDELAAIYQIVNIFDVFVLDGYFFDEKYQSFIKSIVHKLVSIDDKAEFFFQSDVIINHGGIIGIPKYRKSKVTKLFSGFQYLIVRNGFFDAAKNKRTINTINTAFICMGGSDSFNVTGKVLEASIESNCFKKIIIVTGKVFAHTDKLAKQISKIANVCVEHYQDIGSDEMIHYISQSQIAFSTASSISLEICCVKAGLITGLTIDNQKAIENQLVLNKCSISIGNWIEASVEKIQNAINQLSDTIAVNQMMENQAKCIDGKSGQRILQIFKTLSS